jgi:hypothetical protein
MCVKVYVTSAVAGAHIAPRSNAATANHIGALVTLIPLLALDGKKGSEVKGYRKERFPRVVRHITRDGSAAPDTAPRSSLSFFLVSLREYRQRPCAPV